VTGDGARRCRDERGALVTELVVVLLLLAIFMGAVYSSIDSQGAAVHRTNLRLANLDEARTLMAASTKVLRTATQPTPSEPAFTYARAAELEFYGNIKNPGNEPAARVRLFVDDDQLIHTVTTPAAGCTAQPCSYPAQNTRTRFVGRYVTNATVFTYYDELGNVLTIAAPNVGLTEAQRLQVRAVRIQMVVRRATASPIGATTLQNRVTLPNLYYQATTQGS
jgi:hypothetical protein